MRWLLGTQGRVELRALARTRLLVALDFDGTLAPIVARPERARMRARTLAALKELTATTRCVVISGRAREDVELRLASAGITAVAGNHGADLAADAARMTREVARWRAVLERALSPRAGARTEDVRIEEKGLSLSLHYRGAPSVARARAAIDEALGELETRFAGRFRTIEGKRVLNLLPARAPGKADAVALLRRRLRCERVLFIGDDVTDEDVFVRADPRVVCGVRVGRARASRASWYLRDQREIDALLRHVAALRRRG